MSEGEMDGTVSGGLAGSSGLRFEVILDSPAALYVIPG